MKIDWLEFRRFLLSRRAAKQLGGPTNFCLAETWPIRQRYLLNLALSVLLSTSHVAS